MGDLLIRNISDALRADLNDLAELTDGSLSEAAKLAIGEGVERAKKRLKSDADDLPVGDQLRAIFAGLFDTNEEAEEFHREIERERKADFGRPLPEFE